MFAFDIIDAMYIYIDSVNMKTWLFLIRWNVFVEHVFPFNKLFENARVGTEIMSLMNEFHSFLEH